MEKKYGQADIQLKGRKRDFVAMSQGGLNRIFETKDAFEEYIRAMRRPDIGDDADTMTEADFVSDLAETGWPDYRKWDVIWQRSDLFGG
jgi:hypothetical protein